MSIKRTIAFALALIMSLSAASCGIPEIPDYSEENLQNLLDSDKETGDYSREEMELIVDLLGDGENTEKLTDDELSDLVDSIVEKTDTEIGEKPDAEAPALDPSENKEFYGENGEITKPFDEIYPELIETEQVKFSGDSLLLKMTDGTLTDGLRSAGVGALEEIVPMEKYSWYEAKLVDGSDAKTAISEVRKLDEVLMADFNYEVEVAALDDYKHFDKEQEEDFNKNGHNKDQWHFHYCGIVDGYGEMQYPGGSSSVVVAVIDSGVDYNHEDLKDNIWVNANEIPDNNIDDDGNGYIDDYYGVDIIARKGNGGDTNGHGTHVAGIIAARNNNVGVMGVAYNVKIMSVKAAMHNGTLNQADIARAVLYAYEMGAEVINMSFGGTACSIAVQDALATAYTRCVLVASAGNDGAYNEGLFAVPNYPAALTYVLGVMSVDTNGVESSFTNWDVNRFNGVEYELYAPGESIMSTLPGNKYGYLSGTSMAAPIVSAFAAILRSEFSDRDMYPTKFIYGQLASTSGIYADCLDPEHHGLHNLPQIADLNAALTKLPKPEVNLQDYALFDDPKYSDKNNGDGVIDAGETIALGVTLRNRWGMSENTLVTIDTISAGSGLSDPYITIHNPTVNYGSVGTYSTQDCGKIYTDELFTDWENPFLITFSEDCPNDYRFTLNVTIKCENALDTEDETVYVTDSAINEYVRSGYILPSVIEEDMVLTKDKLYIIPNATIIQEGVTVRVEAGTHIQFWSDDADDPYADSYIAYLLVNGKLLVEGTKEEPVYIYPSQLMDRYGVEIGASSSGYVSMKYADITNLFYYRSEQTNHTGTGNRINYAEHCTFRNNYADKYYYRYLENGVVINYYYSSCNDYLLGDIDAKDCVFYKLHERLLGNCDRCIFVQCGIKFNGIYASTPAATANNCVFLGNNLVDQTNPNTIYNSSIRIDEVGLFDKDNFKIYYSPETATTYIRVDGFNSSNISIEEFQRLEELIRTVYGGDYFVAESYDEYLLFKGFIPNASISANITFNDKGFFWSDGTPLQKEFLSNIESSGIKYNPHYHKYWCIDGSDKQLKYGRGSCCIFEIKGEILPTDIGFTEYSVEMDMGTEYTIQPINKPVQIAADKFIYESSDESIVSVSENGVVTPKGTGAADIWVWSEDRAVRNRVTFTVSDYVALEKIEFPIEKAKLEVGKSVYLPCTLTPSNTTRRNVKYSSSDESVIAVNNGMITAVGKGTAVITAECEGATDTLTITTWVRATKIAYVTYQHTLNAEYCDFDLPELKATPSNADLDLKWTSSNSNTLTIENGKLVPKATGTAEIYVTDRNSGLKTSFKYTVSITAPEIQKDVFAVSLGTATAELPEVELAEGIEATPIWQILDPAVAKLEDGKIHFVGEGITTLRVTDPRNNLTDEIFICVYDGAIPRVTQLFGSSCQFALMDNGDLYTWSPQNSSSSLVLLEQNVDNISNAGSCYSVLTKDDVVKIYYTSSGKLVYDRSYTLPENIDAVAAAGYYFESSKAGSLHILDSEGKVYAIGQNTNGILGTGSSESITELTPIEFSEPVVKIVHVSNDLAYYLTESGCLYISGGNALQAATPLMLAKNVTFLDDNGDWYVSDGLLYNFTSSHSEPEMKYDITGYNALDVYKYTSYDIYAMLEKDGTAYRFYNGKLYGIANISDIKDASVCYVSGPFYYAVDKNGLMFGVRNNVNDAFLGMTTENSIDDNDALFIPIVTPNDKLEVLDSNIENGMLCSDNLNLTFNKLLYDISIDIRENGNLLVAKKEINGEVLSTAPTIGFTDGTKYTLTIHAENNSGVGRIYPESDIVIEFTYKAPEIIEDSESETESETVWSEYEEIPGIELPEEALKYEAIIDESIERILTAEQLFGAYIKNIKDTQKNYKFYGNAILNPISTDTNVSHWLRPLAHTVNAGEYVETPLGCNWWGTTNETAIGLQMIDYTDFVSYARFMYEPYLTEAPENTFPFVTSVKLFNKEGKEVTTVGNETITFRVSFNRDMDTTIPLLVRFGSAYPYGDYEIEGQYVDARTWEGTYTLNTIIENGNQYFTISNGCSATEDLELQLDQYRFGFVIDTTAAQALIMQGSATDTGVELKWTQDDFITLMGYNVYRSDKEDGLYTRLNSTVIPADTMEWFDDTVEPGKVYYYNFTVVQTDLSESEPSGKIVIMSKDTMAPNIYHSPVANAFTNSNLVLSATITDNLHIAYANLYYRVAGADEWSVIRMNKLNDKYSAIIPAQYITLDGIEYFIEAFDGVSYTYKGSEEAPYVINVQEAIGADALGDVDGDGTITNLDALLLLYQINDKYNLTAEEFARADLNGDGELWAAEALRILQYVSGVVGSVKM